ncbi:hypothetical protein [Herbiconiux liukaitaii]|uniref:hypothetical protein n=1 Tax=Herbiconiux liukaitaii TaxID=3342799 RepID=UPI0035BA0017
MKKNTTLVTAAFAACAMALITAGLAAPAAFATTEQTAPTAQTVQTEQSVPPVPAVSPTPAVDYEQPTPPTAEQLAAAGLTVKGLTITPGVDSYTVTAESISLANGATDAVFSIGDNRAHNGGVNYTDWVDITADNNGRGYSTTIPIGDGDYTVTVSAGSSAPDGSPLLGELSQEAVSVPAE